MMACSTCYSTTNTAVRHQKNVNEPFSFPFGPQELQLTAISSRVCPETIKKYSFLLNRPTCIRNGYVCFVQW
ncbi:hypothetical protein TNIN_85661 [Trichonephila inaurata madagascariensis]|uniref:Uncharacterized protein n=1 Tax=Trichonephila inaurata madagascariensis TaxID=2747483 RepID=A0A8X6YFD3_9ARAC|nr:hypothetical protein TNIN_85661 [Trichonephila inaurata madagascariensis]